MSAITYLDPSTVLAKRETVAPPNRSASGYGSKIPTAFELKLSDGRWRRVYCVCWSNAGSLYVRTKQGALFLGTYDPRD